MRTRTKTRIIRWTGYYFAVAGIVLLMRLEPLPSVFGLLIGTGLLRWANERDRE